MQKKEAKFNARFNSWCRNIYKKTGAYELKQTTGPFPYRNLPEHQEHALLAATNGTLVYKISDESSGHKPFDCFCFSNAPAFVVILYNGSKTFYLIPINNFIFHRDDVSKRKSLTESEALEISIRKVKLS